MQDTNNDSVDSTLKENAKSVQKLKPEKRTLRQKQTGASVELAEVSTGLKEIIFKSGDKVSVKDANEDSADLTSKESAKCVQKQKPQRKDLRNKQKQVETRVEAAQGTTDETLSKTDDKEKCTSNCNADLTARENVRSVPKSRAQRKDLRNSQKQLEANVKPSESKVKENINEANDKISAQELIDNNVELSSRESSKRGSKPRAQKQDAKNSQKQPEFNVKTVEGSTGVKEMLFKAGNTVSVQESNITDDNNDLISRQSTKSGQKAGKRMVRQKQVGASVGTTDAPTEANEIISKTGDKETVQKTKNNNADDSNCREAAKSVLVQKPDKRALRCSQKQVGASVVTAEASAGIKEVPLKTADKVNVQDKSNEVDDSNCREGAAKEKLIKAQEEKEEKVAEVEATTAIAKEEVKSEKAKDESQVEVKVDEHKLLRKVGRPQKAKRTLGRIDSNKEVQVKAIQQFENIKEDGDIVITKYAKVILSDILRSDKATIEEVLQRDIAKCNFDATQTTRASNALSKPQGLKRRKVRSRAARRRAEANLRARRRNGTNLVSNIKTELTEESIQLGIENSDKLSANCPNSLPLRSKANAHIQSNIPLKKRTFHSSVDIEAELETGAVEVAKRSSGFNSVGVKEGAKLGASEKLRQRGRLRKAKKKLANKKKSRSNTIKRVLRPRASQQPPQSPILASRERKCKLGKKIYVVDGDDDVIEDTQVARNDSSNRLKCVKIENESVPLNQDDFDEIKPGTNFKIRFKRRRGKLWEMENAGFENIVFKKEKRDEAVDCDPFKAIMDSVSILNMEMEAARAHVNASLKSKNRLHRLKKRGERRAISLPADVNLDNKDAAGDDKKEVPVTCDKQCTEKTEVTVVKEPKIEDRFSQPCCMFERKPNVTQDDSAVPVLKLRRRTEDIWVIDDDEEKTEEKSENTKSEPQCNVELKVPAVVKQKRSLLDSLRKDEPQKLSSILKTEPTSTLALSLSPLTLSSPPPNENAKAAERPEMSSGGRKQRHKMERPRKCGPALDPPPTSSAPSQATNTCLSHTLQQIDNSLSRLSEGLCSSQTLEKTSQPPQQQQPQPPCTSAPSSVIQPPSQFPPFTTADNMLSGEPNFTNCCDDILDFQCLNFEGYYQPQNILPSSPSDLCSLDPPTDPFSSPLSHSPTEAWTTETPYLGPPSPSNNFASEDFFPGLIPSSKSESVPLECEAKENPKDKLPINAGFNFAAPSSSDLIPKDRIITKTPIVRSLSKEEPKSQPFSVVNKPRLLPSSSSVTSQSPVNLSQSALNLKPTISQSKLLSNSSTSSSSGSSSSSSNNNSSSLKNQGTFHRPSIPTKSSQSFSTSLINAAKEQTSIPKIQNSPIANKLLSPQLFNLKNTNPVDNIFNFHEKTSSVIQRVLKFQGGNTTQDLYSAPTIPKETASSSSKSIHVKSSATEKSQQHKISTSSHHKTSSSHPFVSSKDSASHSSSSSASSRSNVHFSKPSTSFPVPKTKTSVEKQETFEANLYKNFSALPRPFFFPSKMTESYMASQEKAAKQEKSSLSSSDKHQLGFTQQDPFDFSFGSTLSPMPQHSSPQIIQSTPPSTPVPTSKAQPALSFPYGYQALPNILSFTGDHSLTLGLRDGPEGYPGLSGANYTYHCLMEPSGTQGRLVLEPCGPQLTNPASFSLGGFAGLKSQEELCRKDLQQQCQPSEQQQHSASHYGTQSSHSMGTNKPKRVRLVVTDGTVDLDLQYSD